MFGLSLSLSPTPSSSRPLPDRNRSAGPCQLQPGDGVVESSLTFACLAVFTSKRQTGAVPLRRSCLAPSARRHQLHRDPGTRALLTHYTRRIFTSSSPGGRRSVATWRSIHTAEEEEEEEEEPPLPLVPAAFDAFKSSFFNFHQPRFLFFFQTPSWRSFNGGERSSGGRLENTMRERERGERGRERERGDPRLDQDLPPGSAGRAHWLAGVYPPTRTNHRPRLSLPAVKRLSEIKTASKVPIIEPAGDFFLIF